MNTSESRMEVFERVAELARRENPPLPDVAARVRYAVVQRAGREPLLPRWAFGLTGALSAVACACGWLGWQAWSLAADPLGGWLLSTVVS